MKEKGEGVYEVTLHVTDRGGKRRSFAQKIQVLPLEAPTFYVSSAGDDRADGRSPATEASSNPAAPSRASKRWTRIPMAR